ncbi:hypothetical protein JNW91_31425, partial [Micromonospora sp. STR1_7]
MPAITTGGPQQPTPTGPDPAVVPALVDTAPGTSDPGAPGRRPAVARWAALAGRAGTGVRAGQLVT